MSLESAILAAFEAVDAQSSGKIGLTQLISVVHAIAPGAWTDDALTRMLHAAGLVPQSGVVDYRAFVAWLFRVSTSERLAAATLREHFGSPSGYVAGVPFDVEGTAYTASAVGGIPVFLHSASGVSVLQEAWDLRPEGDGPAEVAFYECSTKAEFARLAADTLLSEETWQAVQTGGGMVLLAGEPTEAAMRGESGCEGLWLPVRFDAGDADRIADSEAGQSQWLLSLPVDEAVARAAAAAERRVRAVLAWRRETLGDQDAATLGAMNDLAFTLEARCKVAEAVEICAHAMQVCKDSKGEHHADTLTCMNNLAYLLDQSGRPGEAEELARQVLAGREATLGEDHEDTNTAVYNLAELLEARGKLDEAEKLFEREHAWCRKAKGARHPTTRESGANLARFRKQHKRGSLETEARTRRGKFTTAG